MKTSSHQQQQTDRTLYIDGDMLVYIMGYASEKHGEFVDSTDFHRPDLYLGKSLIKRKIKHYCELLEAKDYRIVISGKGNWRLEFYPEYKANRVALVKPLCYHEIREWLAILPETIVVNGEEADDYLASIVTDPENTNCVIVSADKDFYTVPGLLFNITARRFFNASKDKVFSFLFFQALVGDRVDGYYGVRWVGERKAKRILQACELNGTTIGEAYLFIKANIIERGGQEEWKRFRLCLDLAALRWNGEVGSRGIGLRRVFKYRHLTFKYYLPYYDVEHNLRYGVSYNDD